MHLKRHGVDIADYTAVHGEPSPVTMSYHQCHICQTLILFSRSVLAAHLAKHEVSVRDYGNNHLSKIRSEKMTVGKIDTECMFSNDYEDECLTICKICDKSLKYSNLGSHIYQSHKTKMKTYLKDFGEPEFSRKTYHECAICHETLLFMRSHIKAHVKTKHDMTISAYNMAHMQLNKIEYSDKHILLEKGRKIGTQKIPQWSDGTLYKCPYCFNIYYRYFTFRIHLINSHKMTDTEERSLCVRENEILTDIYRCKICSTQVKRDRMDIEAHLKQAHKTTLKIYSANFENINVKESAQEMVEKLVRMGVLEEPTKSLCRTPKKLKSKSTETPKKPRGKTIGTPPPKMNLNKPEPKTDKAAAEKDTKFVTVSENVDANDDEENQPKVKTEVYDATCLSQSNYIEPHPSLHVDTESDSQLSKKRKRKLSSRLSSDFEVGQVDSLTPKRSKDSGSKKLSKTKKTSSVSSSSSPLTPRDANTQHQKDTGDQPAKTKVESDKSGAGER